MRNGTFIMFDGIAGSGKTTLLKAIYTDLRDRGLRCFRLDDWKFDRSPRFEEIPDFDVYFTLEPTRTWTGAAIRQEMSQTEHPYSGVELAQIFAIDRSIAYNRLILPALAAGKTVIQDRGISTSIAYQPIMRDVECSTLEEILKLKGNELALANAPDHLILTQVPIDLVAERIRLRPAAQGATGVFADVELLTRVDKRFREPWFRELFESHGTQVHTLDTSGSLESGTRMAIALIDGLLKTREVGK